MTNEPDYYEVLQVSQKAEPEVIEAAYRRLARKYHPDINGDPTANERMLRFNKAFEVLGDPRQRTNYDARQHPPTKTSPAAGYDERLVTYTSKAGKTGTYRATARVQSKFGPGYRLHLVSMDGTFDFWVDEELTDDDDE